MKVWKSEYIFNHSWSAVTTAFWMKYPNPHSPHILAVDVLSRRFEKSTNSLHSVRLLEKTNSKPKLAEKLVKGKAALMIEESVVDRDEQVMTTRTYNLTHCRVLRVEEHCEYKAIDDRTLLTTEVRLVCPLWGWAMTVETFAMERIKGNIQKARVAMEYVIHNVVLVKHPDGLGNYKGPSKGDRD